MPEAALAASAKLYRPKLVTMLAEGYGLADLRHDAMAGLTVAIVALPLSMAIAMASGSRPTAASTRPSSAASSSRPSAAAATRSAGRRGASPSSASPPGPPLRGGGGRLHGPVLGDGRPVRGGGFAAGRAALGRDAAPAGAAPAREPDPPYPARRDRGLYRGDRHHHPGQPTEGPLRLAADRARAG